MHSLQLLGRLAAVICFVAASSVLAAEVPTVTEEEPLPVDSQWKGKFTQHGTHPDVTFPPELEATLTITKRDGDDVELELRETQPGMDITFLCRGRLVRNADRSLTLEFRSHRVKGVPTASFYLLNVPYSARISGNAVKGAWQYVEKDEAIDLSGEFSLTRDE
jgi:hypothetical protein